MVKAGDPAAVVLNEPWFEDPCDLAGFLLRTYRPALHDQFEWTFPVEYKRYAFTRPLPEAAAVMQVIGRRPLDFYMPLHNADFSGAHFYLSGEDPELQGQLASVMAAAGLPPDCGEPEMPYLRELAPGAFRASGLADDYEFYATYGEDPTAILDFGTSSDDYAGAMWDCFTPVAEVPCFTSPRTADRAPAGLTRREAKLRGIDAQERLARWLHFQERLQQECRRARRYGAPLSLLMLDLDDFKTFNDQFGHQIGDEALREVGQILFAATRRGPRRPVRR